MASSPPSVRGGGLGGGFLIETGAVSYPIHVFSVLRMYLHVSINVFRTTIMIHVSDVYLLRIHAVLTYPGRILLPVPPAASK